MMVPASKENTQDEVNSNKTILVFEIKFKVLILFSFKTYLNKSQKTYNKIYNKESTNTILILCVCC